MGIIEDGAFIGLDSFLNLNLSYNKIGKLSKNAFMVLKKLKISDLSNNNLTKKESTLDKLNYLDLSGTGIEDLGTNTFDQLSLKTLRLDDNSIRIIPSNFFNFNDKLVSLSMIRNPISIIPQDSSNHKMKLTYLYLTIHGKILEKRFFNVIFLKGLHIVHSQITELHKYSFKGLVNLKKLNFKNSTILEIEPGAFVGLRNVMESDRENLFANVSSLKSKTFIGLDSLESFNFSKVGMGIIEDGAFIELDSLLNLNLSYNQIEKLSKNAFMVLKKLKISDLSNNNLTKKESTFPIGTFRDLVELTDLHLQHNRIIKLHISTIRHIQTPTDVKDDWYRREQVAM
ncbi:insulin-like growth factor-binding protein complex acid labile subunit [Harmonia axyridis]|uniref:insulin-like growth factor-binding protein complex acid labile subunit n=1 Tax=Harmonia axyridis TaxID=115357 RepID=UPI001E277068|nr:insulin-like growth factor-binding protein complex acid labile subunit [Harmonia axyridis]